MKTSSVESVETLNDADFVKIRKKFGAQWKLVKRKMVDTNVGLKEMKISSQKRSTIKFNR